MIEVDPRRRIAEKRGEVAGEKIVTRHMLDQLRQNTEILLEMRQKIDRLSDQVAIQGAQFVSLEAKLPGIVADAMRQVFKGRSEE